MCCFGQEGDDVPLALKAVGRVCRLSLVLVTAEWQLFGLCFAIM